MATANRLQHASKQLTREETIRSYASNRPHSLLMLLQPDHLLHVSPNDRGPERANHLS
jgi:hypothetical protein